ncbi:cytoplasmic protein [Eikenella sp. Marseille-P7795]|uniref:cytoplasmic protein n=1 Tax=Eikenella sp. Marseille-P7795 TaxID=2866577 RepID=UPI001CE4915B|nr:cytoplasmic protein [Eikenella sp. Marseille-P7795]
MKSRYYLALYKGRRSGRGWRVLAGHGTDWLTRILTRGQYSHAEIAYGPGSGGVHDCLSASVRDGGVRAKTMALPADKWDLFPLPDSINEHGRLDRLYRHTVSQPYDWFGALGVVFKTRQRGDKWFCSEWCAAALGLPESWRWSPNDLAAIVPALYKQETQ